MNTINRIGEKRMMNCGMIAKIIKYKNAKDIDIKFEDGYIKRNVEYNTFKKGQIINPYIPTLYGVGYIGETSTKKDGKSLKSYDYWYNMIKRCYSKVYQKKQPTYVGCSVYEEWKCYANFKEWFDMNFYCINNERIDLDKDILIKGNKIYSPDTCIFVPHSINCLFTKNDKRRGNLPIGVKLSYGKYYVSTSKIEGVDKNLGTFNTMEEAFYAYKEAKEKEIKRVADLYKDKIPQKLYEAMYNYEVEITD